MAGNVASGRSAKLQWLVIAKGRRRKIHRALDVAERRSDVLEPQSNPFGQTVGGDEEAKPDSQSGPDLGIFSRDWHTSIVTARTSQPD
jgi:hypothetical protein